MLMQRGRRDPAAADVSPAAKRVVEYLRGHGATFTFDMQLALKMDEREVALALRELVFAGGEAAISNDQLQSLREVLRVADVAERDERKAQRQTPPRMGRDWWRSGTGTVARPRGARHATTAGNLGGRWFLLPPVAAGTIETSAIERAQQAADRVERFLRRTGFACRELLEVDADGSWKDAYDVLTRMEWAGTVRRGYFVDGIAGSQFMTPGVRLDEGKAKGGGVYWLSMLDPANVWARASTHWVSDAGLAARVPRMAGSWGAMIDGHPVLAAVAWGQRLIPLPAAEEEQLRALATVGALLLRFPRLNHPFMQVRFWDQQDIVGTRAGEILHGAGFTRDPQGLRLYRQYT